MIGTSGMKELIDAEYLVEIGFSFFFFLSGFSLTWHSQTTVLQGKEGKRVSVLTRICFFHPLQRHISRVISSESSHLYMASDQTHREPLHFERKLLTTFTNFFDQNFYLTNFFHSLFKWMKIQATIRTKLMNPKKIFFRKILRIFLFLLEVLKSYWCKSL